jgi:hypothetical protein
MQANRKDMNKKAIAMTIEESSSQSETEDDKCSSGLMHNNQFTVNNGSSGSEVNKFEILKYL